MCKFIRLLLILISITPLGVFSATIRIDNDWKMIVLEGEIIEGDFEKILNAILESGVSHHTMLLASNGGDVREAMKIGRLIRDLSYETEVGKHFSQKNICLSTPGKPKIAEENCICLSSCVLIHLSGIYRHGDVLGVHRAYLDRDVLKNLTLEDSKKITEILEKETNNYLKDMNTPDSLYEKISGNASDKMEMLGSAYVEKNITGYLKGVDEWLIAKCGSLDNAYDQFNSKNDASKYEKYLEIVECNHKTLFIERQNKFAGSRKNHIYKIANDKYIEKQSLLEFLKNNSFVATDIIGKDNETASKMLSIYGLGFYKKFNELVNKDLNFSDSFSVGFDENGAVYDLTLVGASHIYNGDNVFEQPLSFKSSSQDFIKQLGNPIEKLSYCYYTGVCTFVISTPKFDAQLFFESDKKTLRSVNFKSSGWFAKL